MAYNVNAYTKVQTSYKRLFFDTRWEKIVNKPVSFVPTPHEHGNIKDDGSIGTDANRVVVTSSGGKLIAKAAGTTSQFLRGDGSWATPTASPNTGANYTWTGTHKFQHYPIVLVTTGGVWPKIQGEVNTPDGTYNREWEMPITNGRLALDDLFNRSTKGLVPQPGGSGTTRYLREDGSWATPPNTNTTYSSMTTSEINSGTGTIARVITPARLKYAIETHAPSGGGESYSYAMNTQPINPNDGTAYVIVGSNTKFVEITLHRSGIPRGRYWGSIADVNNNWWMGWMDMLGGGGSVRYIDINEFEVENASDANYVTWVEHRWS